MKKENKGVLAVIVLLILAIFSSWLIGVLMEIQFDGRKLSEIRILPNLVSEVISEINSERDDLYYLLLLIYALVFRYFYLNRGKKILDEEPDSFFPILFIIIRFFGVIGIALLIESSLEIGSTLVLIMVLGIIAGFIRPLLFLSEDKKERRPRVTLWSLLSDLPIFIFILIVSQFEFELTEAFLRTGLFTFAIISVTTVLGAILSEKYIFDLINE